MFNVLCWVDAEWLQGMLPCMDGWDGVMCSFWWKSLWMGYHMCHNFISKICLCNQFCYLIATCQFWFCVGLIQIGSLQFSWKYLHHQSSCTFSTEVGSFVNTHEGSFTHHLKKKCLFRDVVSEAAKFTHLINFILADLGNLCYITWNTRS